jgi:hypothetical protein
VWKALGHGANLSHTGDCGNNPAHCRPISQEISNVSGKSSGLFRAIVHFENARGEPLRGRDWKVSVRDADPLADDELGTATLDERGGAQILIAVADILSLDSPGERTPDLYFVLYHYGREVFRSQIMQDVDFEALDPVSGEPNQLTRDFGTLRVPIGR